MKRSRSFALSLFRVAALAAGFALSWVGVVASCSSSPGRNASPKNDAVDGALSCPARSIDPGARGDGGPGNATPDGDASSEASDGPEGGASADGGDDAAVDASVDGGDDASFDGGDGPEVDAGANEAAGATDAMDPCALVTSLDVFFTPQACRAFVSAEANRHDTLPSEPSAPVMTEPVDGDMLTPDNWSIFGWVLADRDSRRDWIKRTVGFVEPSAYAYSPLRGDAYVLEFTQGCTEILRVMLAETAWVPDPASWALLTSLTGPVQIRVFWMRFASDALVSTPVPSEPITITMQGDAGD